MLSARLDQLERDLDIRLPPDFRRALEDPAVHEAFRVAMLDANPALWGDAEVADTVEVVRRNNEDFRVSARWRAWDEQTPAGAEFAPAGAEKPWPHRWLWVGGNFCGDAYFLDLARDPAPVAFWSHESLTCRIDKPSFAAWAAAFRGYGDDCLRSKPPPLARNPPCPRCGAELSAQKGRLCRKCGARW